MKPEISSAALKEFSSIRKDIDGVKEDICNIPTYRAKEFANKQTNRDPVNYSKIGIVFVHLCHHLTCLHIVCIMYNMYFLFVNSLFMKVTRPF